jgi:histidinol-phosphate/aromatic aminotransferase/cobyric acid decarboxylase-like protein
MSRAYPLRKEPLALERRVRRARPELLNLASCELLHPGVAAVFAAVPALDHTEIQFYPYFSTTLERIAALCGLPAETITLSAGSEAMIAIIIEALGTASGRMILQTPNYFGWQYYATLRGIRVTPFLFGRPQRHAFHLESLLEEIQHQPPSLVVVSNPNNPTGFLIPAAGIRVLAEACGQGGHLLVIDECFAPFANIDHVELIGLLEHVVYVRSFSKYLGLAGARVAMTLASPRITQYLAHWRPEAALSGPALYLLRAFLERQQQFREMCSDIVASREQFVGRVQQLRPGWHALPSGGNYVNFCLENTDVPARVTRRLADDGYQIRDVSMLPGLENCIRIGIAHWDLMQGLLATLADRRRERTSGPAADTAEGCA